MKHALRLAWVLAIVTLACYGLNFHIPTPQCSTLYNLPWIDRIPAGDRDTMRLYLFMDPQNRSDDPNGIRAWTDSMYLGHAELFRQQATDSEIRYTFPHDNFQAVSGYKIERQEPDDNNLNLKLTLQNDPRAGGRTTVFYSSTEWQNHHWPAFITNVLPATAN